MTHTFHKALVKSEFAFPWILFTSLATVRQAFSSVDGKSRMRARLVSFEDFVNSCHVNRKRLIIQVVGKALVEFVGISFDTLTGLVIDNLIAT